MSAEPPVPHSGPFGGMEELIWHFIPESDRAPVSAMQALAAAISDIIDNVSDPGVALAKLAWWQQECRQLHSGGSQHPLLKTVTDSGVADHCLPQVVDACIRELATQAETYCPQSVNEFETQCRAVEGSAAMLFTGLAGGHELEPAVRAGGAMSGLLLRLEQLGATQVPQWMPMDLMARFSLKRTQEQRLPVELLKTLADQGRKWGSAVDWRLVESAPELVARPTGRYWLLRQSLVRQRLLAWQNDPERCLRAAASPRLRELISTWLTARRLFSAM